jgi:bifunctional pyridoxal-dependent enzyme with beta-cystathionase and maltose regulon repressor activities
VAWRFRRIRGLAAQHGRRGADAGVCFGQVGEGWVRISLLKHTAELFQVVARVDRALRSA